MAGTEAVTPRQKNASHIKWAPEPASEHERRPLLDDDIERARDDSNSAVGDEDAAAGTESAGSVSRLHRKSKLGLLLGRGRRPSYSSTSSEYDHATLSRRKWWTYAFGWALLVLLVVGVIVGAVALDKDGAFSSS
jgi:hypothetical protein